jgi:acetyl/propionyl-CoA carboxylase alpha subunit
LTDAQREYIGKLAVRAAKAVGYVNAGTVEFLLDQDNQFYFMEMNTRLQVEHCITENITGIDIVQEQIRIADGLPLQYKQDEIKHRGFAMEFRINAEDPKNSVSCPASAASPATMRRAVRASASMPPCIPVIPFRPITTRCAPSSSSGT